jgi:3-deoxy-D-manno-octulosonic-acid transferase
MNIKNREILSKNRFWIAASTHNEEEKFCLQVHLKLKKKYQNIITVIAPRHIERVKDIKKLCDKLALNSQILDDKQFIKREREIIIINSFGSLPAYFKLAKSVFIGKSMIEKLKNVAGQSPIEAAKFGCKIYHGPYVYNFKEIYEILQSNHISEKINNTAQLGNKLIKDLKKLNKENNRIPELINNLGQKTLADTMKNINNFLFNEIK